MYTNTAHMAVQLFIPKDNTLDDALTFETEYIAYYGTYLLEKNEQEQMVIHNIIHSNRKELLVKSVKRKLQYHDDNYISLTNVEPEKIAMQFFIYRKLFWQRLRSDDG